MLYERLVQLRKEKKLTQVDLSKKLGITRSALSQYELGSRQPDYETLQKIAEYFSVSIDWLITGRNQGVPRQIISQNLPRIREKYNLTHQDIAKITNVDTQTVYKWESGDVTPNNGQLEKINEFLSNNFIEYALAHLDGKIQIGVPYLGIGGPKFSNDELKIIEEIKKHPVLFHDLANAPEKKIKQLIKMWEFINKDFDEEDNEDIIED